MTKTEFQKKYKISNDKLETILKVLDVLYLEYTKEQVNNIIQDYYQNANNIYNSK